MDIGPISQAYTSSKGMTYGYPAGVSLVDTVPDQIKPMIHPHWANFPPVNPMWHYLLGTIYIMLGITSFFGNGIVMKLYLNNRNLRTPSNKLVFNLAFSDFLMMVTQYPIFIYNSYSGGMWMFSPLICELYACTGSIFGLCSLWSLVFISYDRYNVIVKGMSGTPLSSGKATIYILFCWIYSIGFSLPPFFGWGKYIPEGILDSCSFDYLSRDMNIVTHGICLIVFMYIIPLLTIIFAYVFIVQAIFAHEKAMREQAKKMNVSNLRSNQDANAQTAEVRIAKVAMTNVALWIICWTPYATIVAQGIFFDQSTITPLISILPALLAKSASCYNPIIYAISHPKFRLALQKDMPWFCIHEPDDNRSGDSKSTASVEAGKEEI